METSGWAHHLEEAQKRRCPTSACGDALLRLSAAHTAPSWGLPRLQEGWQLATKDLCGTVLRFPQSLKPYCFASWSPVGNCAFLQRVWSGPQVTSGVLSPRWEMLPKLPRSVFQTGQGQNLSLPFHCSTPGRATD